MRTKNFTKPFFFILFSFASLAAYGQSLSGKVSTEGAARKLGYANVDIYKNGKLVANVLTDAEGNFTVKLDTGVYQCEINYAGYEKVTKEIRVTKDEKADFGLAKDTKSKYVAIATDASAADSTVTMRSEKIVERRSYKMMESRAYSSAPAYSSGTFSSGSDISYSGHTSLREMKSVAITSSWGKSIKNDSASSGKLTAGEINDFSKWNMWTDLTKGELSYFRSTWYFAPTDRYMVQLTDQHGLPLANAKVELLDGNVVLYTSRSDNTGKAELWGSLKYDTLAKVTVTSIRVNYNNEIKTIGNVKKFESGINSVVFTTTCQQSSNVDIAIVVDATGSMQDEIDYLKYDLNDVIFKSKEFSSALNLRFANVFYRDQGDAYVTESQDFTRVLSESAAYTNAHNAGGGGDTPEAVETALDLAINKLSWSEDTRTKLLFLVLDASPHNTLAIQEQMRNLSMKAAEKGIRIIPVAGSGITKDTEYLMRCLALATNGTYIFLDSRSGIGNDHIKPSTDHYQVEILNDLLVRVIKSYTYMPTCEQKIADLGVNLPSALVVVTNTDTTTIDTAAATSTAETISATPAAKDTLQLQWKFYPNPTNGVVNIVSNENIPELYISDLSGKVLQVVRNIEPATTATVDLSGYATGIYLIRYPMDKQWVSGQIVLSR
jgi:hypothetical protein